MLVALVATLLSFAYSRSTGNTTDERRFENYEVSSSSYPIEPPDPKYPPPAEHQRNFYVLHSEAPIHYEIQWSIRNRDREPLIGKHEFTISLYNSLNKPVELSAEESAPFTIGCIARDNPYRATEVERQSFTFEPYETKKVTLSIDVSCLYLGTADGQYFWRIY